MVKRAGWSKMRTNGSWGIARGPISTAVSAPIPEALSVHAVVFVAIQVMYYEDGTDMRHHHIGIKGKNTNRVIESWFILYTVDRVTVVLELITALIRLRNTRDGLLEDTTFVTVQLGDRLVVNDQIGSGIRPNVGSVEGLSRISDAQSHLGVEKEGDVQQTVRIERPGR